MTLRMAISADEVDDSFDNQKEFVLNDDRKSMEQLMSRALALDEIESDVLASQQS